MVCACPIFFQIRRWAHTPEKGTWLWTLQICIKKTWCPSQWYVPILDGHLSWDSPQMSENPHPALRRGSDRMMCPKSWIFLFNHSFSTIGATVEVLNRPQAATILRSSAGQVLHCLQHLHTRNTAFVEQVAAHERNASRICILIAHSNLDRSQSVAKVLHVGRVPRVPRVPCQFGQHLRFIGILWQIFGICST